MLAVAGAAASASFGATELPPPRPELPAYADRMDAAVASVATAAPGGSIAVARAAGLEVAERLIEVEIFARKARLEAVRIEELGGVVSTVAPGILEARVPARVLDELGVGARIRRIAAPLALEPDAITGQGVGVTNASAAHAAGITGQGVRMAVVDVGFAGYANRQASGDLPASLTTQNYCGGGFSGSSHGTAVAEIAHEMAPGAQLYLVCADSAGGLAAAEAYLAGEGVRVINHSVSYFNSSAGDGSGGPGSPDATVAEALADGIFWANASGNQAQRHWSGSFNSGSAPADVHDWVPGDQTNTLQIASGGRQCFALKWDSWPLTGQDFDLLLYDQNGLYVTGSSNVQDGNDPPTENFCYTNPGPAANFALEIYRFNAVSNPRLDLFAYSAGPPLEHLVTASSVTEPASSPATVGVGAFCFATDLLRGYSSQGPTIDGRLKPDLSAPTDVSVFGGSSSGCGSGFGGTSAASPHVAGAAALLMQGSSAGPAEIEAQLEATARDLGPTGADYGYGVGAIHFPQASTPAPPPEQPGQPDLRFGATGDGTYSSDLFAQRSSLRVRRGRVKVLTFSLENDGGQAASVALSGDRRWSKVLARYSIEGADVTGAIVGGTYVRDLAAGAEVEVTVTVRAKRSARRGWRTLGLFAENAADPTLADTASISVKVR